VESQQIPELTDEQLRALRFELVSRLADDIAHEIKNPLNSIVINLEVLRVRIGRQDTDAALERAGVIEHEARRLHALVDRLLQLLRPERDPATSLALDQLFDELLPLVEARVRMARNEFRQDCTATFYVPAAGTYSSSRSSTSSPPYTSGSARTGVLLRCAVNRRQARSGSRWVRRPRIGRSGRPIDCTRRPSRP
jgi:signal transduction histidine kinase